MSNKKVILVTGASSGIGYQTAEQLAKEGHIVYGAARRVDAMKPLEVFGVTPIRLDITDEVSIKEALNLIIKKENRIDVLVNNAGYGSYGAVENVRIEEAKMQFEVNIFGLARLTQLVLPYMRKQNSGRIINVGSMGGRLTSYFGAWYLRPNMLLKLFQMVFVWKWLIMALMSLSSNQAVLKRTGASSLLTNWLNQLKGVLMRQQPPRQQKGCGSNTLVI